MNVRIFGVRAIECMCAQTRPRLILSSERVLGNGVRTEPVLTPKEKSPPRVKFSSEEYRTSEPSTLLTSYSGHFLQSQYPDTSPTCPSTDNVRSFAREPNKFHFTLLWLRMVIVLNEIQARGKEGFRNDYSTADRLKIINELIGNVMYLMHRMHWI